MSRPCGGPRFVTRGSCLNPEGVSKQTVKPQLKPWQIQSWNPGSCDGPPDGQYITVYNLCLIIYIVRTSFGGDSFGVFLCGFPGKFFTRYSARKQLPRMVGMWLYTKRTLPDYLHRPYIFRRGQLSRFFFWVPWEVFHTVLCLIICIVRTSFGGDSYRVFFSGFPGKFFTRYSA